MKRLIADMNTRTHIFLVKDRVYIYVSTDDVQYAILIIYCMGAEGCSLTGFKADEEYTYIKNQICNTVN